MTDTRDASNASRDGGGMPEGGTADGGARADGGSSTQPGLDAAIEAGTDAAKAAAPDAQPADAARDAAPAASDASPRVDAGNAGDALVAKPSIYADDAKWLCRPGLPSGPCPQSLRSPTCMPTVGQRRGSP